MELVEISVICNYILISIRVILAGKFLHRVYRKSRKVFDLRTRVNGLYMYEFRGYVDLHKNLSCPAKVTKAIN